jgi:CRP/FNR family cyclic AMP-dependent transcriptional regulator
MQSPQKSGWSEARAHRPGEFFSSLAPEILRDFHAITSLVSYPANAVLFQEQREANSILILVDGCAKISMNSRDGKRLILWIARPGELLGLTSVVRGSRHEVTAETVHPCRATSIRRPEFLDFLIRHPAAYECVARELSVEMSRACEQMRIMGLSSSASIKLAWLLLEWSSGANTTVRGTSVHAPLTHEEMGECIGVTRETVSRAMGELRERGLIDLQGSALIIKSRFALAAYAQGLHGATPPDVSALVRRAGRPRRSGTHPTEVTEITAGRKVGLEGTVWRQK